MVVVVCSGGCGSVGVGVSVGVCGAGVMYCVPVHVFMHGASEQLRKGRNENKSTGKKMIGMPMSEFEPTSSC